ncbi:hypothetical protein [Streptomyces sp. NPDC056144]|uniref:hypothetical protein n=1 Tax=unclassified Streptomyces TaxID=2593676 RepID=UPI0035D67530
MRTLTTAAVAAAGAVLALVSAAPVPAAVQRPADTRAVVGVDGTCHDAEGSWACTVETTVQDSKKTYGRARVEGEVFVNCTRNAVTRTRSLQYATAGQADFAAVEPAASGRTPTSFTWTKYDYRDVAERVEVGEVSWVEVQGVTEKGTASFLVRDENGREQRLTGTFEGPAAGLSDRIYQRTGPMTTAEQQRCASARP